MSYSIVSLFALLVIILVNYEILFNRKYPTRNSKALLAFRIFLIATIAYLVADIAWGFLDGLENKTPVFIVTSLYFLFMSALLFAWTNYVRRYIKSRYKAFNYVFFFAGLAFAISGTVLVIINFFRPIMFTYEPGVYSDHLARDIFLLSQSFVFFGIFVYCIVAAFNKTHNKKAQFLSVSAFCFVMMAFTILQYFYPLYPQYAIGLTLGNVIIHLFVILSEKKAYQEIYQQTQTKAAEQAKELGVVQQLAYADPLTGIKNKHAFVELEEHYDQMIRDHQIKEFSLFIFDLNDLKLINDTYGHDMGDKHIIKSVDIIKEVFPGVEIYRYGGDEFIVILYDNLYEKRFELFNKFNSIMDNNVHNNEPVVALGFSDFVPEKDNTIRTVFMRADERMYGRKKKLKHMISSVSGNPAANKQQTNLNLRMEMFEMFYRSENVTLIDMLNGLSSDEILEVDMTNDTYKQFYHVKGKYFVPAVGLSYRELVDFTANHIVHPEDKGAYLGLMKIDGFFERLANARIPNFDFAHFRYKLQDGEYRYVEQVAITGEENGIPDGMFRIYIIDIDNLKSRQLGKVSDESSVVSLGRDPITGLLTGKEFFAKAEEIITGNKDKDWCLLSLDIEHFKFFDEWFGREKGDRLLAKIGVELKAIADEKGGVAGYFGQDDFSMVIQYQEDEFQNVYDRIHNIISDFGLTTGFLPAIGVAKIEKDMVLVDAFDRATIAESKSKKDMRHRIHVYNYEMQFLAEQEYKVLSDFMKALQNDEITFYLQPQCRISTGAVVGAEALARWIKRDGEVISPAYFIPVLEKYGFITDLDKYIWEKVMKGIKKWIDGGHKAVPISLNVSRVDIFNLEIAQHFHDLCDKYEVPHNLIKIEITESSYVEITETIDDLVRRLRKDGFLVIMDDFGSGYSSLNMLSNLELDAIKLDAYFLHLESKDQERGIHIIESVVNMAKTMALPIIVEGVENKRQVEFLEELGCRYVQGFYFYKPMPQKDFEKVIGDEKKIDGRGFVLKNNEQFRVREFLDKNIYSDSMLNSILGAVAIYAWDEKERVDIIRYNQQFYESVHVPDFAERLVHIEKFLPEEDRPILYEGLREAKDNRLTGATKNLRFFLTNGMLSAYSIHFYYLGKKEGTDRFYGSANKVTELMDLKDIKQLVAKYSTDNLVFVTKKDNQWYYTVISHGLSDVFGLSPEELQDELNNGKFVKRMLNQKGFKHFMSTVDDLTKEKREFTQVFDVYGKNNKVTIIETVFTPVEGANNVQYIIRTRTVGEK